MTEPKFINPFKIKFPHEDFRPLGYFSEEEFELNESISQNIESKGLQCHLLENPRTNTDYATTDLSIDDNNIIGKEIPKKKITEIKNNLFKVGPAFLRRKHKKDDQEKKYKSHLFKYYLKEINNRIEKVVQDSIKNGKLNEIFPEGNISNGLNRKIHFKRFLKKMEFTRLSQNFIMHINHKNEKKYKNLTYRELLEKDFDSDSKDCLRNLYHKNTDNKNYLHNLEVLKFLDNHQLLKEKSGFEEISEMTYTQLTKSYLSSDDFKKLISDMKYKEGSYYTEKFVKSSNSFLS